MNQSRHPAFENDKHESSVSFPKRLLTINNPFLELPADFRGSPMAQGRANDVSFSLSATNAEALKKLSSELNIPVSAILLAAYQTLVFRYTGQSDAAMGFVTIENNLNGAAEKRGPVYNTKYFAAELWGNLGFAQLAVSTDKAISASDKHSGPPDEILEDLNRPSLRIIDTGLYYAIFSPRRAGADENNTTSSPGDIDLVLYVHDSADGLNGVWVFNSDLFVASAIERTAKHFETLLDTVAVNARQTIAELEILTDKEKHQLTSEWNISKINYPSNLCIHELFEVQAAKTPSASALVFEKKNLTYAELNERSNQLAHYLRSRGVKRETPVPICIGRSLEMIIGILGILKAGGTYVPADPNYPLERLNYLFDDVKAFLIVCSKESKKQLTPFENIEFVEIDGDVPFLKNQPINNLDNNLSSNNLAYIIYTSGSTGKPKGVMIEHRALVDHCYGMIESSGLKPCKSFALFSPLVFDAGHSIIHSCFLLGSCLHVLSEDLVINNERTADYIDSHAIDCIKIVPSLWLSHAKFEKFILARKVMVFGGEVFALSILSYLKKANYAGTIINHYGPTEVTIGKCIYTVDLNKTYTAVPIGKPFSNTQLYILDEQLQLVPIGVAGELFVAGDGLARGYLNNEIATSEKFIVNPFSSGSMDRMYRTGDKVRWLPDGNIEYLGRTDEQVKIRGHRIELGEIEDALLQSELVRQGVVLAIDDKKGNKRLVACIVPAGEFTDEAITAFLKKKLPEYMIPVTFVELKKIPLTVNGKINKKDLATLAEKDREYTAPQNETETQLAIIWQDLLKIERISIFDNFFELGGNSIDAVGLISKIKKKFGKSFPLAFIFNAPTIQQLAAALRSSTKSVKSSPHLVPIQPKGSKTPIFAMHAGQGHVLFYANLSLHLGLDQPFYGLQARGMDGLERPILQMEQMAACYLSEIRKVQPNGPYYLAGYCLGAQIAFEIAKQLTLEGQEIALLANFNGISPIFNHPNLHNNALDGIPRARFTKALGHLKKRTLKNKVDSLVLKSIRGVRSLFFILINAFNSSVFNFCLFFKIKPPGRIARLHVTQSNYLVQTKYNPRPYPGSMIIFRSPEIYWDPYLGWKTYIKGKIKTFDIPGKHKTRRDVMNEPHVQILAKQLQNFLEK